MLSITAYVELFHCVVAPYIMGMKQQKTSYISDTLRCIKFTKHIFYRLLYVLYGLSPGSKYLM